MAFDRHFQMESPGKISSLWSLVHPGLESRRFRFLLQLSDLRESGLCLSFVRLIMV